MNLFLVNDDKSLAVALGPYETKIHEKAWVKRSGLPHAHSTRRAWFIICETIGSEPKTLVSVRKFMKEVPKWEKKS